MGGELVLIIFSVAILIMSIVVHEVSHGWAAFYLGDPTAKYAGRLTFNPIKHLDPWGSLIVPFFMIMAFGFGFGWAKPVPYNPYNLKNQKNGPALVGLAGPLSNIFLALFFGLSARIIPLSMVEKITIANNLLNYENVLSLLSGSLMAIFFWLFIVIALVNVVLAVFNLFPIPPLDGSKLLFAIIPIKEKTKMMLEQFGFMFLLVFIFLFSGVFSWVINFFLSLFFKLVVGLSF